MVENEENPWLVMGDTSTEEIKNESVDPKTDKEKEEENPDLDSESETEAEKKEEEHEEDKEKSQEDENEDDDENPYAFFGKFFAEKNLIEIPEDLSKIETEDDLSKAIEFTVKKQVDDYKENLPSEFKELLEFVENGGDMQAYLAYQGANQSISEIELEDNLENQKLIYKAYLEQTLNIADEAKKAKKIEALIESAELEGSLIDEANDAKSFFIDQQNTEKENLKKQAAAQKAKDEAERKHLHDTTKNLIFSLESINELPLKTTKEKQELYDYIYKPVVKHEIEDNGKKRTIMITQYQADNLQVQNDEQKRLTQFLFHALASKKGFSFEDIKKKGVTEHTQKIATLAKKQKTDTAAKLNKESSKNSGDFQFFEQ